MTPETKLRNAVVKRLQSLQRGGMAVKWMKLPVGMGIEVGTPDMLIVLDGRAFFVELKVHTPVTVIQQHRMKEWAAAGATCAVARSVDDVVCLLSGGVLCTAAKHTEA